jgi:hypothetical protein
MINPAALRQLRTRFPDGETTGCETTGYQATAEFGRVPPTYSSGIIVGGDVTGSAITVG